MKNRASMINDVCVGRLKMLYNRLMNENIAIKFWIDSYEIVLLEVVSMVPVARIAIDLTRNLAEFQRRQKQHGL